MKIYVLILMFFTLNVSFGTPELDTKKFTSENIDIVIIKRYEDPIQELYYDALTKNLNDYISSLKSQGKLKRGKMYFQIMTAIWMDETDGVEMYRYKKGYHCSLNGLVQKVDQQYLTRIINYFSSDKWRSFCYDNKKIKFPKTALKIFNERLNSISRGDYKFLDRTVVQLNCLKVVLRQDKLICESLGNKFGEIKWIIPFSKENLDFLVCEETVYVLKNNKIIAKIKLKTDDFMAGYYDPCIVEIFSKWINFTNNNGYFLSYSIQRNKFYKLDPPMI